MILWLASWTERHGWFGYWLPGFFAGLALGLIVAVLVAR